MNNEQPEEVIAVIGESKSGKYIKQLSRVSWNDRPARLDLRTWYREDGTLRTGRGISLTDAEARTLLDALTNYFK